MAKKRWTDEYVQELLQLRYEQRMTIQEIGNIYNISRERVRQIIGNSGRFVTVRKEKNNYKAHLQPVIDYLARHGLVARKITHAHGNYNYYYINEHIVKIVTHSETTKIVNPKLKNHFQFRVGDLWKAEFLICFILGSEDIFIIPTNKVKGKEIFRMAWPTKRPSLGKFQRYYNRIDLLT